jgi:serine/threonine protein kinase
MNNTGTTIDANEIFNEEFKKNNIPIIPENDIIRVKPFLGEGKFGKVYSGNYHEKKVAIKKMMFDTLDLNAITEVITEIKNLNFADCVQVPKFFGIWKGGSKKKHFALVFEFIEGCPLRILITQNKLNNDEKISILIQVGEVMSFIHKKKLLHRDIKPENIMVDNDKKVKLIDFGTAKIAEKTISYTSKATGTTFYMAPDNFEVDVENETDKPIQNTPKIDVWSLGCLISEMITGVYPWMNLTKNEQKVESYLIKKHAFPIPKEVDTLCPNIRPIIVKCTQVDPNLRCTADEAVEDLKALIKK